MYVSSEILVPIIQGASTSFLNWFVPLIWVIIWLLIFRWIFNVFSHVMYWVPTYEYKYTMIDEKWEFDEVFEDKKRLDQIKNEAIEISQKYQNNFINIFK